MILLIPTSAEVPEGRTPPLWPALVMVLCLCIGFLTSQLFTQRDAEYISKLQNAFVADVDGKPKLTQEANLYLSKRPLLKVSPAKGDWDLQRLLFANFVHGTVPHLILNLIGIFAGARLCSTFIPFLCTFSIFLLGGSLGLFASLTSSREISQFIPHVGASGGIFALMGTYYVYNFLFRTKYFFWFPSRHGFIALRTKTFFFIDVLLLELLLSIAQFVPNRIDSIDHLAHVVGFGSGVFLAILLRTFQKWPGFLQTRDEFLTWVTLERPKVYDLIHMAFQTWMKLLRVNAYNDQIKLRLCKLIGLHERQLSDTEIEHAFSFFSPTFIRLQTPTFARCIYALLSNKKKLPVAWLQKTPYDSIIRIAKELAKSQLTAQHITQMILDYQVAHQGKGRGEKLSSQLLMKLTSSTEASIPSIEVEKKS